MAAVWLIYILACLFGQNPLIANPALPYLGFMLLALSYSYSGYTKVLSPSWLEGNNIIYLLNNPLARDYFLRDFFLWIPPIFLQLLTLSVLFIELFFAPLAIFSALRPILWGLMALIQLGFACLLNFFDSTSLMLLFHLITFDPTWVPGKDIGKRPILFYDRQCGLCHGVIKFLLAEDGHAHDYSNNRHPSIRWLSRISKEDFCRKLPHLLQNIFVVLIKAHMFNHRGNMTYDQCG